MHPLPLLLLLLPLLLVTDSKEHHHHQKAPPANYFTALVYAQETAQNHLAALTGEICECKNAISHECSKCIRSQGKAGEFAKDLQRLAVAGHSMAVTDIWPKG